MARNSLIHNELRGFWSCQKVIPSIPVGCGFPVGMLNFGHPLLSAGIGCSPNPHSQLPVFKHFWDHPPPIRPWASHHQRKRIAAAIEGEPRLFSWLVARDFTRKIHQKGACCNRFYQAPKYVEFEPQKEHQLTGM